MTKDWTDSAGKEITAEEILSWLERNVTYLEHGDSKEDAYWPHSETDIELFPIFFNMSLSDYVKARIKGVKGEKFLPENLIDDLDTIS